MIISQQSFFNDVCKDVLEAKKDYPFIEMTFLPTVIPTAILEVIAVSNEIIEITQLSKADFVGPYSKRLIIIVPYNYKHNGCEVYGANWLRREDVEIEDYHFFNRTFNGLPQLCVGTPASFKYLKNVIFECIKTADNMLVGYECLIKGISTHLEIIAYAHGKEGEKEYERNKRKYRTK